MNDIYLYPDVPVLKNKLGIKDEKVLDVVEAEQSVANMVLLYDLGFSDFTNRGICYIHKTLFGDIYDWAGQYRVINIQKREAILAGKSVWYSNAEDIDRDLERAWQSIRRIRWKKLNRETFAKRIAHTFPALWQAHPFREGNTRAIVMLMTFFVEQYNYFFDQELLAASAGYVRNAFVLASQDQFSEYEHLEKILLDAICVEPPFCEDIGKETAITKEKQEKYERYRTTDYTAVPHEYRPDTEK